MESKARLKSNEEKCLLELLEKVQYVNQSRVSAPTRAEFVLSNENVVLIPHMSDFINDNAFKGPRPTSADENRSC